MRVNCNVDMLNNVKMYGICMLKYGILPLI